MIEINFVNTATLMPFCKRLKDIFHKKLDGSLLNQCEQGRFLNQLLVLFVSPKELDSQLKKMEIYSEDENNPDILGIFIPYYEEMRDSVIMISPEKIIESSYRLLKKYNLKEDLQTIYEIYITKVILHELGHYLVSSEERFAPDRGDYYGRIADKMTLFETQSVEVLLNYHQREYKKNYYREFSSYRVIEETLANRFVLSHSFLPNEKELIQFIISKQPQPYNFAKSWYGVSNQKIMDTMESWKYIKTRSWYDLDDIAKDELTNKKGRLDCLEQLAFKLQHPSQLKNGIDFNQLIVKHFIKSLDTWKSDKGFEKLESVYYHISHTLKVTDKNFEKLCLEYFNYSCNLVVLDCTYNWHKQQAAERLIEYYQNKNNLDKVVFYYEEIDNNCDKITSLSKMVAVSEVYKNLNNIPKEKEWIHRAILKINDYPDHYKARNVDEDLKIKLQERLKELE